MRYFIFPAGDGEAVATATAETEATAQRLERLGFLRCTVARWRAARQANDATDRARLFPEDVPVYPTVVRREKGEG